MTLERENSLMGALMGGVISASAELGRNLGILQDPVARGMFQQFRDQTPSEGADRQLSRLKNSLSRVDNLLNIFGTKPDLGRI